MKSRANYSFPNRSSGFSLIELSIVLGIMALLAAFTVPNMLEEINERRAAVTIQDTQTILDAARVYRSDNGAWPGGVNCTTAMTVLTSGATPYLAGVGTTNKYNNAYTLSCLGTRFMVTQRIIPDWDSYVANGLPATTITNAATNTIRTSIGVPGTEPAFDSKLSRNATGNLENNRMRTNFLMGGNAIQEGGDITFSKTDPRLTASNGSLIFNSQSGASFMNGTLVVDDVMLGWGGRRLSDALPNYVHKGTYLIRHGWLVVKPTCLNGGVPKASMRPGTINAGYTTGARQGQIAMEWRAIDSGATWLMSTNTLGDTAARDAMDSLVDVYCYYTP